MLVTADAFESFLEQAEYLLSEGYKDAAAVLVGGVLECHASARCCDVRGVPTDGPKDTIEPLNAALAKHTPAPVQQLVQKQITAWADLRNSAAHGRFTEYARSRSQTCQGVREFAGRHVA